MLTRTELSVVWIGYLPLRLDMTFVLNNGLCAKDTTKLAMFRRLGRSWGAYMGYGFVWTEGKWKEQESES